ncbi:MAG: hypothetical protein ABSC94_27680, partial [Polyangiaceae bacterium]
RAKLHFQPSAPPALRALAAGTWIPSQRTPRQQELLTALNLVDHPELGTTLETKLARKKAGRRPQKAA